MLVFGQLGQLLSKYLAPQNLQNHFVTRQFNLCYLKRFFD